MAQGSVQGVVIEMLLWGAGEARGVGEAEHGVSGNQTRKPAGSKMGSFTSQQVSRPTAPDRPAFKSHLATCQLGSLRRSPQLLCLSFPVYELEGRPPPCGTAAGTERDQVPGTEPVFNERL